jgi:integrase
MARNNAHGVRGLIKLPGGRWRVDLRWRSTQGTYERYRETFPAGLTATAAKARARALLAVAMVGGELRKEAERTLEPALDEYLKWRQANGRTGVARARFLAAQWVAGFGDVALSALSPLGMERYKRDRQAEGKAHGTVNRGLAFFKHFLGLAATWGWISRDLAAQLREVRLLREPPGRVRYVTEDEEPRLMAALEARPALLRLAIASLMTGARQGELITLRRGAVDLRAGEITLTRTKNGKVRRIPIAKELGPVLRAALEASRSDLVFESAPGIGYAPSVLALHWNEVRAAAGLEDLRWHDLRHSAATNLRRRGVGLDVIQAILGHSSLAVTQRYAHVQADAVREALCDLPAPAAPVFRIDRPLTAAPELAIVK